MTASFRGIFTPHLTPLSSAGDLDEATLRRYLDWLIDQGIQGLFPAGSTGEFVRFDEAT
ncbi:MAG: dihydrodipicolinate synthase family protein, partial [Planctomycetota bacterium]